MPELPEVETVKRIIEPQLVGQTVLSVTVNNPQIIAHPDAMIERIVIGGRSSCHCPACQRKKA